MTYKKKVIKQAKIKLDIILEFADIDWEYDERYTFNSSTNTCMMGYLDKTPFKELCRAFGRPKIWKDNDIKYIWNGRINGLKFSIYTEDKKAKDDTRWYIGGRNIIIVDLIHSFLDGKKRSKWTSRKYE